MTGRHWLLIAIAVAGAVALWATQHRTSSSIMAQPAGGRQMFEVLGDFYEKHAAGFDADAVRQKLHRMATSHDIADWKRVVARVFDGKHFMYTEDRSEVAIRPDRVLDRRSGNCLGLSTVCVLLLEEIGVSSSLMLSPTPLHVVVSVQGEVLDPSRAMAQVPSSDVVNWRTSGSHLWFGNALSVSQVASLHVSSIASARLREGGPEETSTRLYELSLSIDDSNPYGYQGLARRAHLDGNRDRAEFLLRRALAAAPDSRSGLELARYIRAGGSDCLPEVPRGRQSPSALAESPPASWIVDPERLVGEPFGVGAVRASQPRPP